MKILSALAVVLVMWTAAAVVRAANDQQTERAATLVCTLKVSGMTCAGCEAAVRIAARSVDGVTEAKASHAKGNAEVTYDPSKTTPDAIAKVITAKSGFKTEAVQTAGKQ